MGYVFRIMGLMWKRIVSDKAEQVSWTQYVKDFGFYPLIWF